MVEPGISRGGRGWRPAWSRLVLALLLFLPLERGMAQATTPSPSASGARHSARADSLFQAAFALEFEEPGEAIRRYRAATATALREGDSLTLANARYRTGMTFWGSNLYDSALVHFDSALAVRRKLDDGTELARVYNGIGSSYYQLGVYEPALEAFVQALRLRRASRDSMGLARTLTNIGKVYHDWGQLERANVTLEEAAQVAGRLSGGAAALGYALNSLAMLEIDRGNFAEAQRLITESIAAYARPGGRGTIADTVEAWEFNATSQGVLFLREGRPAQAAVVLDSVLRSATARGSNRGRARALLYLGEASLRLGDLPRARARFTEALSLARVVGQRIIALEALDHLSELEHTAGNASAAVGYLRAHRVLRDTIFDQDAALRIASREARAETDAALRANLQLQARGMEQQGVISRQRGTVIMGSIILALVSTLLLMLVYNQRRERDRATALAAANAELASLNAELRTALTEVRTLSGLIPICANCKKVRDDRGYWEAVETFVAERSDATFSHSICQSCGPKLYGDLWPGPPQS